MLLGKVIGTVVATRKEPALEGSPLLLVRGLDAEGKPTPSVVVAVDALIAVAVVDTLSGKSVQLPPSATDDPSSTKV